MSEMKTTLNDALKAAMVAKDTLRRDVIRMAQSAIKQVEVDERRELTDDDVLIVLQREVKKQRESIEEAENAGRAETVELESAKLAILESFLPAQLTRDEIVAIVHDVIAQTGASGGKDKGKVMGALMPRVRGKADGRLVNDVVTELLK